MAKRNPIFYTQKPLSKLTKKEWELLCDGCGRCCLMKLEDEDTGELFYTDVACKLFDQTTCQCGDYRNRIKKVTDCLVLSLDHPEYFEMLPDSCAYRRRFEGKQLLPWHPLISGDPESVHQAGISVRNQCVSEESIHPDELETRIIKFSDTDDSN